MELFAREVMSGRKRGLGASLLRAGLWTAQWPYRVGVGCKNFAFDFRIREPFEVGVPVISVGNLTTGGTGKTPIVAFLANWFRDAGANVGLLSRGYRSLDSQANDEKLVLDQLCPGVPQWLHPDRILSAKRAVIDGCNLLILDDAFQHRRVHRDLDIVLIDATNPWGYEHCLPRGLLREPIANIERADLVIVTRADQVSSDKLTAIRTELVRHNQIGSVIEAAFRPSQLLNSAGQAKPLAELSGQRVLGFCGIGNPESFEQTLRQLGSEVVGFESFPDHHHFTSDDLARLGEQARSRNADWLLTTHKDLVKIHETDLGSRPLWAVRLGTEIVRGTPILESRLWSILEHVPKA
jgi:tetraacyldisaccharide 4'-kinase